MNKIIIRIFSICLLFTVASCSSDYLDINDDPNNPIDVKLKEILPSIQVNLAGAMGASAGGLGNYTTLYTHQTVQRGTEENDYAVKANEFGVTTPWRLFGTYALNDIEEMLTRAEEQGEPQYNGMGKIMKAYIYSIMVDIWGDVPFSEAQQGDTNRFPQFDDDEAIYDALLVLLDEGILNLEADATLTAPAADDLFYGGDVSKWIKFANTLKLKMYTQMRLIRDVSGPVAKLIEDDNMIGAGDDFEFQYGTSAGPENRNPAYAQEYAAGGARNYVSPYFFEILSGINTFHTNDIYTGLPDPRIPYYIFNQLPEGATDADAENPCSYCPSRSNTSFLSIWMFSFNIDPNEGFDQSSSQSVMGLYPIGGRYDDGAGGAVNFNGQADTPQRLLTFFARKYLEAELAQTGVIAGDAAALFEEAVRASFDKVNDVAGTAGAPSIDGADVDTYVAEVMVRFNAADDAGKLEHIMTQKWIATYGFGIDAYTDYRRTGYPRLHDAGTDNLNVTSSIRDYPVAFPWPQTEIDRNLNAPEQRNITTDGIFWDN